MLMLFNFLGTLCTSAKKPTNDAGNDNMKKEKKKKKLKKKKKKKNKKKKKKKTALQNDRPPLKAI